MSSFSLQKTIEELYGIVGKLESQYPGRHFTLDGHLVGSLGEVYAAERYGLTLYESDHPKHDAVTKDGREVQIKATQRDKIGLNSEPENLIVLRIDADGGFKEIYNGPGKEPWEATGRQQTNGQSYISLSKLEKLNQSVSSEKRISVV